MGTLRTSPGAITPRDMDARQWATYAAQIRTQYYRDGQTDYDTGTGFWIGNDAGTPKLSIGNSAANKVTWDGSTLSITGAVTATSGSIAGSLTVGSGGSLSSGQSAYDTGTGFWLEYNSGTPRFSIGNSAANKLTWSGTALAVTGSLNFTNSVQTFTPSWSGFSSAPSGDISYISFGAFVMMWRGTALTGTSNAGGMTITNLPAGITPSAPRKASCIVVNNGLQIVGAAEPDSDNTVDFYIEVPNTTDATVDLGASSFVASGTKGLAAGWIVIYPLN